MATKTKKTEIVDLKLDAASEEEVTIDPNSVTFQFSDEALENLNLLAINNFGGNQADTVQRGLFLLQQFLTFREKGMVKVTVVDPNNITNQITFKLN